MGSELHIITGYELIISRNHQKPQYSIGEKKRTFTFSSLEICGYMVYVM